MTSQAPDMPEELDAIAAEYVLGTLDAAERASIAARRRRELPLDAACAPKQIMLDKVSSCRKHVGWFVFLFF